MSFQISIDVFEGPFDLLLQLIMRQELEIHQVPVAQITESFIEHIKAVKEVDLDTATEFLVIAATLLLIKARSLLSRPDEDQDDFDETEDAREYLIDRLVEYKKFSGVAGWLEGLYGEQSQYYPRLSELELDYSNLYPDPFEGVSLASLPQALIELLVDRARDEVDTFYIAPIKISVAEYIEKVQGLLKRDESTTFDELVSGCSSKIEVIATFLAVLELYKRGEVALLQRKLFGAINIKIRERKESSVA